MGTRQSVDDLVSAWITRCYSKLRFALSRRHVASSGPATASNNDVHATRRRRSSQVVCDPHNSPVLKATISQLTAVLRDLCYANRCNVHAQPRIDGAYAPV